MSLLLGPLGIQISTANLVLNGNQQLITPQTVVEPRGTDYESPAPAAGFTAYVLACEPGAYVYVGNDATLTLVARQNYTLTCAAGAYAYSGVAASLKVEHSLVCSAGSYAYTGNAAALDYVPGAVTVNYALTCDAGTYVYTGRDATLTYVSGAAQEPVVGPGSGHPAGMWWGETKIKRGKHLDSILKKAMQHMVEDEIELEPETAAAKAVEIVKPFVTESSIDWQAVESDLKKVKALLSLWKQQMEDLEEEEMLLMMMAN